MMRERKTDCCQTPTPLVSRLTVSRRGRSRGGERGQTLIMFALSAIVIVVTIGFAADGGYGLVQSSEAQNAADFASLAVSETLAANCQSSVPSIPQSSIYNAIADEVALNDVQDPTAAWTAEYLTPSGNPLSPSTPVTDTPSYVPAGACGLSISVSPTWLTFVEGVIGVTSLSASSSASSKYVSGSPGANGGVSIVAMGGNAAHSIFMGGLGYFTVTGTIADNANGIVYQGTGGGGLSWGSPTGGNGDVIDEKQNATMSDNGLIQSYVPDPFDGCFSNPNTATATGSTPALQITCNTEQILFNSYQGNVTPALQPDPFYSSSDPTTYAGCPGSTLPATDPPPVTSGGITYYFPGTYDYLVQIRGNAVFLSCTDVNTGAYPNSGSLGYTASTYQPGLFAFQQGLEVLPVAGDTVTGSNIMLIGEKPIAQFAGGGAPFPAWMDPTYGPYYCSDCGPNSNQPLPTGPSSPNADPLSPTGSAFGTNTSIDLGGSGNITLSGVNDTTGDGETDYNQVVIWQDRNYVANIGVDAIGVLNGGAPDGATGCLWPTSTPPSGSGYSQCAHYNGDNGNRAGAGVTINNSVIYNNSEPNGNCYPMSITSTSCSGGTILGNYYNSDCQYGGLPFTAGGALLAGIGDENATSSCADSFVPPTPQHVGSPSQECPGNSPHYMTCGTFTVNNGVALVDRFATNGFVNFQITGSSSFHVGGVAASGPTLTG